MEACASAHYWARRIEQLGQRVLPPHQVRPYVKRNKIDRTVCNPGAAIYREQLGGWAPVGSLVGDGAVDEARAGGESHGSTGETTGAHPLGIFFHADPSVQRSGSAAARTGVRPNRLFDGATGSLRFRPVSESTSKIVPGLCPTIDVGCEGDDGACVDSEVEVSRPAHARSTVE